MKEEDITIVDNYKDLILGDYLDILNIDRDKSLDEVDRQVKTISILTGKSEDFILDLPILKYQELSAKIQFLHDDLPSEVSRLADSYKIGEFDLIPVTDMRKVITAQYIDFQTFHQAGMEEHFVEILSCLLVPRGKKYCQDYDILEVQSAIRGGLSVHDAASLYAFFMISCRESIRDILIFSLQEAKKIQDKVERERRMAQIQMQITLLQTNGDGSPM